MTAGPGRRLHYRLAQGLIRAFAHVFLGYRATGTEHVPAAGSFLVAASHKTNLDPPLVGASLHRELRYFAKQELFRNPLFGRIIASYGAIPVDRGGADRHALTQSLQFLKSGQGLLVFPEGTRIRRPGLGPAKPGIGMLAVRSGAPVIPVWAGSIWNPRRSLLRRCPVTIRCGPPLVFSPPVEPGAARRTYEAATEAVMAAIARLAEEDAKFEA